MVWSGLVVVPSIHWKLKLERRACSSLQWIQGLVRPGSHWPKETKTGRISPFALDLLSRDRDKNESDINKFHQFPPEQ